MIPKPFIQSLLARVDIVELVERYLPLRKGGVNYFACCPFHGEKSPSFSVSPTKQFYHCFGCGAHGTAIDFLMEHNGLSFVDAVHELARFAGLEVPDERRSTPAADFSPLYQALTQAHAFYRQQLAQSGTAQTYLRQRGLSPDIAARYGLGYAPAGWDNLRKVFDPYPTPSLIDAGLLIRNEEGRTYDRFRDRLMFPIHDRRGQIIGFGGRVLGQGEPKYLNSPETPLFEKGRELYGLHLARPAIRADDSVLVVEGYMDVVALAQFGIENAVATLGTATTATHIQTLMRQAQKVVFCFDGDKAGRKAALRALDNALDVLSDDRSLSFLFLPPEHDPDSFVRAEGADAFRQRAQSAMPLGELLIQSLQEDIDLHSADGRARLLHRAQTPLARIRAPMLRLQLTQQLAHIGQIPAHALDQAIEIRPAPPSVSAPSPASSRPPGHPPLQRRPVHRSAARRRPTGAPEALLRLILQQPGWASRVPPDLIPTDTPHGAALVAIVDAASLGELSRHQTLGGLLEAFRDTPHAHAIAQALGELEETPLDNEIVEALFADTLAKLQSNALAAEIAELIARQRESGLTEDDRTRLGWLLNERRKLADLAKNTNK